MKFPVLPFVFMIPTSLLAAEFDGLQFYVMSQATSETYVMERAFSSNRLLKYRPANADGGMERSRFS